MRRAMFVMKVRRPEWTGYIYRSRALDRNHSGPGVHALLCARARPPDEERFRQGFVTLIVMLEPAWGRLHDKSLSADG